MKIQGKYSSSFYTQNLSNTKLNSVKKLAISIRDLKNDLSEIVNKNLLFYLEMSKIDFQKHTLPFLKEKINSNFVKQIQDDVYTSYQNKFDAIQKKLKFESIKNYNFIFYKRKTKNHEKGELKNLEIKRKSTPLTITLTYLARYGGENTLNYIHSQLLRNDLDPNKIKFYQTILDHVNKFGYDRLLKLALSKRTQVLKKYSEHPIEFKSLNFRGRSRLTKDIISYNTNFNSVIKSFINISWLKYGEVMTLPIKYSKDHHGPMKLFTNGTDTSYTVCFSKNKEIRVILTKDDFREYPENKTTYVGIDVNVKYNLMCASDGHTIDYDRKLVDTLLKELKKIDEFKKLNDEYEIGKKRQIKIDSLRRQIKHSTERKIVDFCKYFNKQNFDHAVFEDLQNTFGKSFIKDENDLNFNRKLSVLNLCNIKNEFTHIAKNYGICVSTVQSHYTSQTCPVCGCIDSENRLTQEIFECIECKYRNNADIVGGINIRKRVASTVLRGELLKKGVLGNGTYEPKFLKKERVKEVLLSFRNRPTLKGKVKEQEQCLQNVS